MVLPIEQIKVDQYKNSEEKVLTVALWVLQKKHI